jgi:two-component system NtrC family sensor kinase
MREDLKMIVEQADRCKTIVGGLLNFARKNKAVIKKADVRELLARCVKAIKMPADISVTFTSSDGDCTADIDVDQMIQVFINIVTNAVEAMPTGGKLAIGSEHVEGGIRVKISDTGTGIKHEILEKIFEPFFTTKQMGKGTGLGLAVTYGIIKMHRGNIEVISNTDPSNGPTGSTFIVTLPAHQDE